MKVIVGLSGGVDSAVSLYLLKKKGYDVEALFMRNWDSTVNNDILGNPNDLKDVCPQEKDYLDAKLVCRKLGVKLHRVDFVKEYWDDVFRYLIDEYQKGRTPNPDILCNKYIKFDKFLEAAKKLGANKIAMGHFVRRKGDFLYKGKDKNKDQSYFLSQLTRTQISESLFPVGSLTKTKVRKIAKKLNLPVAKKKDSTGVCFIGERNFKEFLKNYIPAKPGNIVDLNGNVIGTHEGIMYYTIGQRHGLKIGGEGEAWFVAKKDVKNNLLICCQGHDSDILFSDEVEVENLNILTTKLPKRFRAKFRYRSHDLPVKVIEEKAGVLRLNLLKKGWAITPGQAASFYLGKKMIGGGFIKASYFKGTREN